MLGVSHGSWLPGGKSSSTAGSQVSFKSLLPAHCSQGPDPFRFHLGILLKTPKPEPFLLTPNTAPSILSLTLSFPLVGVSEVNRNISVLSKLQTRNKHGGQIGGRTFNLRFLLAGAIWLQRTTAIWVTSSALLLENLARFFTPTFKTHIISLKSL